MLSNISSASCRRRVWLAGLSSSSAVTFRSPASSRRPGPSKQRLKAGAEKEEEEEEEQAGSVLAATLHTVLKAADVLDEPGGLVDAVLGGRAQVLQVSLHLGVLGERHEQ